MQVKKIPLWYPQKDKEFIKNTLIKAEYKMLELCPESPAKIARLKELGYPIITHWIEDEAWSQELQDFVIFEMRKKGNEFLSVVRSSHGGTCLRFRHVF